MTDHDMDLFGARDASPFDLIRQTRADGSEFWSARDLMPLMGYATWRNFEVPVERAKASAQAQSYDVDLHFAGSRKVIEGGRWGTQEVEDFHLTRFAAYLVAMNGDPNKQEVAAAQAYFAVKTREAETTAAPVLSEDEIVLQALQIQTRKIKSLEAKVAEDAPKVDYVDTFVADDDALLFRTVASTLNITEKALRTRLLDAGWIYAESSRRFSHSHGKVIDRTRYSEHAHKKPYFYRRLDHDAPRFKGEVMHTLKITPAGATAVARLIEKTKELHP